MLGRSRAITREAAAIVKTFRYNVIVHWGDTDPAKIVFYPNYFIWFDESTRLFWDSVGLDWDSLGKRYGVLGLPIVEAQAKFVSPSRFRDEIVSSRGSRSGTTRLSRSATPCSTRVSARSKATRSVSGRCRARKTLAA